MNQYIDALKRPFSDFKKLGIGFLFYVIPFVSIITRFFALGYELECARTAMKKQRKLPEWNNFGNLFVRGLLVLVIGIIYFIPLIILLIAFTWQFIPLLTPNMAPEEITNIVKDSIGYEKIIILFIVILLFTYILPIAILFFIRKYEFSDAFKIKEIFSKAFKWNYFGAWIFLGFYWVGISLIVQGILYLTKEPYIVPIVLNSAAAIVFSITKYSLFGRVFKDL
ncbi:hypothetical protein CMO90_02525 [Candidatus Woesearchaeota archaeon]|jgi:hypothetical protein|nr:hypothetical protein [Candidatus Woesearchaeota archaeon]|tara:strand:+ start:865 stop:1536 length:672 start_codon:yes stop_codon:yes gene_type:complete